MNGAVSMEELSFSSRWKRKVLVTALKLLDKDGDIFVLSVIGLPLSYRAQRAINMLVLLCT